MDKEGYEVAEWFKNWGVATAVLKYRVKPYKHPVPMQDVQRAIRYVRAHATELGIDPERIGVMGFSAGGHLAATASTLFAPGDPASADPIERVSSRPDFAILAYPVITFEGEATHKGSRRNLLGDAPADELVRKMSLENQVTAETPPTFLFHTTADTGVPPENSILFYEALRKAGVAGELHIYRDGPHGVGLNRSAATSIWPEQLKFWMEYLDLLVRPGDVTPKWIWTTHLPSRRERAYFRRTVDVPSPVKEAYVVGTCESEVTMRLNGKSLFITTSWKEPLRVDVTERLRQGLNVLTAEARAGGRAGLLVEMVIHLQDGEKIVVPSDRSWLASRVATDGWQDSDFDSGAHRHWNPSAEVARLGDGPWAGDVNAMTLAEALPPTPAAATPVEQISLLEGFQAELLYSVPREDHGSWVAMTVDPRGRLIVADQYDGIYRLTPPPPGGTLEPSQIETIDVDVAGAHGLLYAFDSLYVMRNEGGREKSGLYRVRDTDGDDRFDEVKLLRNVPGSGEHGTHSIVLSPDGKSLHVNAGNGTDLPQMEESVVPRVWQEDLLLPRDWDARGHARGRLAPGGWIARVNPEGTMWELVSIGYRNEFDIAFNPEGDLFSFDADMEWDLGTPWYRPTRVCHAVSGSEFGWRSGTGKWPSYYPDTLPSVVDIGPGSPTGIVFGTGAHFPEKYQRALFICDWSFGKVHAVHLEPDGATWKGTQEQFMAASPLPVTDLVVNPKDGALYVAIGGRKAQSGLYRITHKDPQPAIALTPRVTPEAKLRRRLEQLHRPGTPDAVRTAWTSLTHHDRFVRHAARIAIELQPVESWQERALAETNRTAAVEALIALARHGDATLRPRVLAALDQLSWEDSTDATRLAILRAYSLTFIRMGSPEPSTARSLAARWSAHYPARSADLNRELSRFLVYLEAEGVVQKTLALLEAAPTQEEQIHYAFVLRVAKNGWTLADRKQYFAWFQGAMGYRGGASFQGFLRNIKARAVEGLSEAEIALLSELLEEKPPESALVELPQPEGPGKDWTVDELLPLASSGLQNRDFQNGKNMFAAGSCFVCHRFDGRGGATGPDLTGLGGRFNHRDLVESIVEPSKVISDQYQATIFEFKDDVPIVGRIVNMGGDTYYVNTDMMDAGQSVTIRRNRVHQTRASDVSMMPTGLLNQMNENEVLDLLAYLLSRGDSTNPMFGK
jgi:putative heme-binding domain-containing protein